MNGPRAAQRRAHALRPRRVRDESGAVAVEFALILPILVMLLLGVTTAGLTYSDHLAITNAAREGGRQSTTTVSPPSGPTTCRPVSSRPTTTRAPP